MGCYPDIRMGCYPDTYFFFVILRVCLFFVLLSRYLRFVYSVDEILSLFLLYFLFVPDMFVRVVCLVVCFVYAAKVGIF